MVPLVTDDLLKAALQLLTFERAEIVHAELLDIISSIICKHAATAPVVKDVLLGLPNMTPEAFEKGFQEVNKTSSAKKQRRIVKDTLVDICGTHMRALAGQKKTAIGLQISEPQVKNPKSPSFYDGAAWDSVQ